MSAQRKSRSKQIRPYMADILLLLYSFRILFLHLITSIFLSWKQLCIQNRYRPLNPCMVKLVTVILLPRSTYQWEFAPATEFVLAHVCLFERDSKRELSFPFCLSITAGRKQVRIQDLFRDEASSEILKTSRSGVAAAAKMGGGGGGGPLGSL